MSESEYQDQQEAWNETYLRITYPKKDGDNTMSASGMKTWMSCRLKWFFEYKKGWKVDDPSLNLVLGTSFHAAAEKMNREVALGRPLEKEMALAEYDLTWNKIATTLKNEKDYDKNYNIGRQLVERYINSTFRKTIDPLLYYPKFCHTSMVPGAELPIYIPMVRLKSGKEIKKDWYVTGFIDLIARGLKDTRYFAKDDLLVLDYKTAAQKWDPFTVKLDPQLLFYSYAMRYMMQYENNFVHLGKKKEDRVGIICLVKQKASKRGVKPEKWGKLEYYLEKFTDNEIVFLENLLYSTIEDIERCGDDIENYQPSPSPFTCNYCKLKEPCLTWRKTNSKAALEVWGEDNKDKMRKW